MRLSQIKLAGFKSFVDPTHIHLPGQIVGVVGPNGCGKSNVIDALRWVLGESRAQALRGESMQDVIFNGSDKRKPVARASVELVFDNSLGKAAGQWSSYAEISIGRVLQRNGESTYFINNQKVRRRDVTDIFLGTGLGARAYAIVEQGMISRIIEAKPEELRVFLEEAAGVSKYRDRRKDTAQRLSDTRENLQRVADILQELDSQLERLGSQAEVAQRYRALHAERETAQQLFWLFKKREAQSLKIRHAASIEQMRTNQEARSAALREVESRIETLRASHFQLSDDLHARQGDLYGVNARIAGLEQEIKHAAQQKQRLMQQIESTTQQIAQQKHQQNQAASLLEHWQKQQEEAGIKLAIVEQNAQSVDLHQAEEAFRAVQAKYNGLQQESLKLQQQLQLAKTQHANASRNIVQIEARKSRLLEERSALQQTDDEILQQTREEMALTELEHAEREARLSSLQEELPKLAEAVNGLRGALQQEEKQGARIEARLHALQQLQHGQDKDLQGWLKARGLEGLSRLWQSIRIKEGWEVALEAVLRERLNALPRHAESWTEVPPARLAIYEPKSGVHAASSGLLELVHCLDDAVYPALREWLSSIHVADDLALAIEMRDELSDGDCIVTPEGHMVFGHGILFHAPDSQLSGVLARQREIEQLEAEMKSHRLRVTEAKEGLLESEQNHRDVEMKISPLRREVNEGRQKQHALQLQLQKLTQANEHNLARRNQIDADIRELEMQAQGEREHQQEILIQMDASTEEMDISAARLEEARRLTHSEESALREMRANAEKAQHALHEARFFSRTCDDKIADLNATIKRIADSLSLAEKGVEALRAELSESKDELSGQSLQEALDERHAREQALSDARNRLDAAANDLQKLEQDRMSFEHGLAGLRDKLNDLVLKEQEARLYFEQWEAQLQGVDESGLITLLADVKPAALQGRINRLAAEIEALGAVNLAALEELQTASERRHYLDAQSRDLQEAIVTLEEAIRRIDRESRELLMETFNQVNLQLSEIFPILFAGGEARLVMSGEDILDGGVHVMAQPPGKKNSSIHLLSGGEKALTAIALIFSMFRLNPAPFCLLDEVDAPLDDANTERLCSLVARMAQQTQFVFISHNKIAMEMAHQLIGVTMQEKGVSKVVTVDVEAALRMRDGVDLPNGRENLV